MQDDRHTSPNSSGTWSRPCLRAPAEARPQRNPIGCPTSIPGTTPRDRSVVRGGGFLNRVAWRPPDPPSALERPSTRLWDSLSGIGGPPGTRRGRWRRAGCTGGPESHVPVPAATGSGDVTPSLANSERTGDSWHLADAHRIKVDLHQLAGDDVAAEAAYRRAMDIARAQIAKDWELRATNSLAWLWRNPGKARGARELMAPVYDWFTEGFDTPDLRNAKTMFEELK